MQSSTPHFISRRTDTEFRIRRGSYLTLRTFYAFGARSREIPALQRSLSYNTYDTSWGTRPLLQSTGTNSTLRRSSTAASIQKLKRSSAAYRDRYFTSVSSVSKVYSSSVRQIHPSSIFHSPSSKLKRDYRQYQSNSTAQFLLTRIPRSTAAPAVQYAANAANEKSVRLHYEQPIKGAETLKKKDETVVKENSAEVAALIERNKTLESEVERLRSRLRDKERSEGELRRKMLEYAAEVKVWQKKCEIKQTARSEVSESKSNEEEISDIVEQLNTAAEKLTRLNAVKDLKLLQSEMETALKEISQ